MAGLPQGDGLPVAGLRRRSGWKIGACASGWTQISDSAGRSTASCVAVGSCAEPYRGRLLETSGWDGISSTVSSGAGCERQRRASHNEPNTAKAETLSPTLSHGTRSIPSS
eukprot:scaffold2075_cov444-Prasinococcus_capsulatus_cf.AAC.9